MRLKISHKLFAMATVIIVLTGGSLVFLASKIYQNDSVINDVIDGQAQLLSRLDTVNAAVATFGSMRFWLADLAVSWQNESENSAEASYAELQALLAKLELTDAALVPVIRSQSESFRSIMLGAVDAYVDENRVLGNSRVAEGRQLAIEVDEKLSQLAAEVSELALQSTGGHLQNNESLLLFALFGLVAAIVVGGIVTWFVTNQITRPIAYAVESADRIAVGDLSTDIESDLKDEVGQLLQSLKSMQQNLRNRVESDRISLAETSRVKQALDSVSANVMVADANLDIIYMNDAVRKLFAEAESDIRKDLPNFEAGKMMGTCIDLFHTNPPHQRNMLANLSSTHTAELELGGRTMKVVVSPVIDAEGERLGTVAEWTDRTQELAIEAEVQHVVDSALVGDLTNRITLDDKDGFFERLSGGVNELVGVAEKVINDTVRVLSAIAGGQLTETIVEDYEGSFGQLKDDANATVAKLTEVVGNIQAASGSVKTGADEISQGNASLSQRTEEQASSLEETASSMEEMTSTVKQNADNAGEANQLAMAAREQAEKGGTVVSQAVKAMNEINASSKKISDIIGVIDEIAFQTNLLALNASVEAARAGDQGRGFAVVASEVRNLAGRSATAAKEIKELIEDSGAKVDEGSRLVNESGEMLEEIVNGVKKVTDIVGEIAAASQEQSAGIDEVNKAIVQLDELTQQNAALVEEASAASQAMGEQADDLNEMMTFFTVDHDAQVSAPASNDSLPGGTEHRSADRPWTGPKAAEKSQKVEEAAAPAASKRKAATAAGDQEWEEF